MPCFQSWCKPVKPNPAEREAGGAEALRPVAGPATLQHRTHVEGRRLSAREGIATKRRKTHEDWEPTSEPWKISAE